jgi:hypothetical protein
LQYATKYNLSEQKIAANLLYSDINIHNNLRLAEQYALSAKQLWDSWKVDSVKKDSIKLELYYRVSPYVYT